MKKLILLFLVIPFFSLSQEEEITLKTKTGDIKGSLLVPSYSEKASVVLIISGSGPTDRNGNNPNMTNNSLMMLANELKKNGIASLRFDKRGIGESSSSGMQESDLRFENYVNDVKAWVDLLKESNKFSKIIVLGHSEGSLIGMIASQKAEVEKFISVAGAGNSAGDIIREQLKAQPAFVLNQSLPIIEKLENGEREENVPQMLYALFRPSVQPYMISWFKYDPQIEIAKLNKPVLIVQGTTDIQVSVLDADKLASANNKAQKQIIEGMNHILKEAEMDRLKNIQTYSMPDLPLKKTLIEIIVKFIEE
ncbi:MAG: alpha/beta hydrolase [Flavobacteriaceae bacterium]|nr:alpha/beta hydrolase [Flavobacteriaceae bacterium]